MIEPAPHHEVRKIAGSKADQLQMHRQNVCAETPEDSLPETENSTPTPDERNSQSKNRHGKQTAQQGKMIGGQIERRQRQSGQHHNIERHLKPLHQSQASFIALPRLKMIPLGRNWIKMITRTRSHTSARLTLVNI